MTLSTPEIHHVTSIATDPQTNVDFYTDIFDLEKRESDEPAGEEISETTVEGQ